MTASERAVEVPRKEVADLMGGTISGQQYEVPVFIRQSRPGPGAGVRLTLIDDDPGRISEHIEEFRLRAGPVLLDMLGLSSAQFLVDRDTGRSVVVTTWDDMDVMASMRQRLAALRTDHGRDDPVPGPHSRRSTC